MLNKKENSLKTVRTLLGLKGTEVAQCLNISVQNIRTWEYGKRPSIDSLEKLSILYSNVLQKRAEYFNDGNENNSVLSNLCDKVKKSYFTFDYLLKRQITDKDEVLLEFAILYNENHR